jgi:hypothetical protein
MLQELRYLEEWSPELDLKLLARVALHRPGGGQGRGSASPYTRTHSKKDTAPAASPQRAHSMGFPS